MTVTEHFFVGDPHVHSTRSDGRLSPSELFLVAAARGLDFLALTDHYRTPAQRPAEETAASGAPVQGGGRGHHQAGMCCLDGQEVSAGGRLHFLLLGYSHPVGRRLRLDRLPAVADQVHAAGGVVVLAHPWLGLAKSPERFPSLDRAFAAGHLDGLEVFSAALLPSQFGLWQRFFAHFLREWAPHRPAVLASSDWHHRRHGRAIGLCCTYLWAPELTPEALLGALAARRTVAALQPATALEDGLFSQPLPFPPEPGREGLQWGAAEGGAFCGPRQLVQLLLRQRSEALKRLRSSLQALPPGEGPKREVWRSALAAYAAGNYRRTELLLEETAAR
ncbi:MAG TPA: CehA/McbA family metallohydrolase [Firmicutes bacterium]|nr:CehA/McbA family metallohydrolase [Bacillota bacterium]